MDDLEKRLKKVLDTNGGFDIAKSEMLRKEVVQMWCDKNLLRAKVVFWVFFLLSLGMMLGGYIGLRSASETKAMLCWVIFFMIGFNSTILMKLWYWVVDARFKVLKEVKQLQLQVAEMTGTRISSED